MGRWKSAPEPIARVWCDKCGAVRVTYKQITVRVNDTVGTYRFICPDCGQLQVQGIHPALMPMMLSQPFKIEQFSQITQQDIEDFRRELADL